MENLLNLRSVKMGFCGCDVMIQIKGRKLFWRVDPTSKQHRRAVFQERGDAFDCFCLRQRVKSELIYRMRDPQQLLDGFGRIE